jgi:aspartate dehydrogenase
MDTQRFTRDNPMRVGLGGFGNVGQTLARTLSGEAIPEARLTAISAADLDAACARSNDMDPMPVFVSAEDLPAHADVIVECATGEAFPTIARAALNAGKILLPVSVAALATHPEILDLAEAGDGTIRVVTGALPGLDSIRGARESGIHSVKMTSNIRPESLAREAYIIDRGFDFSTPPATPVKVFEGSAREAGKAFPRHFNVGIALSLSGIGPDRTEVEVWANNDIAGTTHEVYVDSNAIKLTLKSENLPSPDNPRTSSSVAPSVMAALRSLVSSVQVGS